MVVSRCSKANGVVPALDDTPILVKVLDRCRETVVTLRKISWAISLFSSPAATSLRTATSRSVEPAGSRTLAPQPTGRDRWPCADGVVLPQPHCTLSRSPVLTELVVGAVRRFTCGDALVETTEPPCGLGPEVEPVRLSNRLLHAHRAGGVLPGVTAERDAHRPERVIDTRRDLVTHDASR